MIWNSSRRLIIAGALVLLAALILGAWSYHQSRKVCCGFPDEPGPQPRPALGLMTSLPIYWPLGAGIADMVGGAVEEPWQREVLERGNQIVPLDTLSPIAALDPDKSDTDPLAGLERIAIIQPRGLSPADNVALDQWVRAGGRLLLALDPALTGEYDLPLGDPRRPTAAALVPPVVGRWGARISFDESQPFAPRLDQGDGLTVPVLLAGEITGDSANCASAGGSALLRCAVGEGSVTLLADAAIFEHQEIAGEDGAVIVNVLRYALDQPASGILRDEEREIR